ncbi:2-methylthioadenine synthase [Candidatus Caldarchaeum subterraneum]|uniref:tRNA-t(6)A37 methylthiotransferase n=1 Tax=Caldiarchaeum subterraneum TaxID=311458 RepID=E6N2U8_CALS0|nr:tRNA modifying enzyme [Candidatus Caldarchaeum subterraneum]BAJ50226.1 2-methylthioadenine synthase [Candidatus Caldarchaeum subterraneum]
MESNPHQRVMPQKVYAEVYGCSANQADGEIALGILQKQGYIMVERPNEADYVVLVTCAVKKPTADRMIHRIKKFSSLGPRLIVAGCMATGEAERVRRVAPEAVLLPPRSITEVSAAIEGHGFDGGGTKLGLPRLRKNPVIAIVPVSEGCRWSRCSFCIVPRSRPGYESYPVRAVVDEVRKAVNEGCREVWLTSQDMGSYGLESGRNLLPELIESVNSLEGKFYTRIGMMNPIYLKPILQKLVKAYSGEKIYKFIHVPVQSGSDKVLKDMNRGHSVQLFYHVVEAFRRRFPSITVSTDLIVGYPTETDEDFEQTLKLVEKTRPAVVNVSRYFPRPGTPGEGLKTLPHHVVARRVSELNDLLSKIQLESNEHWLGWVGEVLINEVGKKGKMMGRNFAYRPIVLDAPRESLGRFVEAEVVDVEKNYLLGRVLSGC